MSYSIEQNFIPGLPKEAYDKGHYIGVIAHATANNGDSDDGERHYESTSWQNAFVHFFVDDTKIEQVADYNYVCFGAGHTANHLGYVQVELCQTTDAVKFAKAYVMYTWLLAKLLYDRKLGVKDGETLMSHAQVSAKWHETTHTDPCGPDGKSGYLGTHGKTWADVVQDVTNCYNSMAQPAIVGAPAQTTELYRVRTSWQDEKSQVGSFHILQGAIITANRHPGTKVFNEAGQQVYPAQQPTPAPASKPGECATVSANGGLHLRVTPAINGELITTLPNGTQVQVLSKLPTGWWQVNASGHTGYVDATYLTTRVSPAPGPQYATVATTHLPLLCHRDPNIKAPIVGEFPKGTKVEVYSKTTVGWWEVGANGIRGWVATEYLK